MGKRNHLDCKLWSMICVNVLMINFGDFVLATVPCLPQKSHVGMSVNKIRKKCGGTELSTVAKKLIKSWKKLLPGQWVGLLVPRLLEERARIVGLFVIPNHLKCRNCNQGDRL